ncbi:MAG: hypothetical protein QOE90_3322 [Thermoplasmata archaeon]|jgi:hypothetical protein|nr:hypothetical protein [Thermoplasmata archaeon]
MRAHLLALLLLALLVAPTARADDLAGSAHLVHVTDTAKHSAGKDTDVTYGDYQFTFSGNAPNPNAENPSDRVGGAWILLVTGHKYHSGGFFKTGVDEDNAISYTFTYNTVTVLYQTTLHLHSPDVAWYDALGDLKRRPTMTIHYVVYENNTRVLDDSEEIRLRNYFSWGIPDTHFWLKQENTTFTITPEFDSWSLLPARFFEHEPPDSPGRIVIENQTYNWLEIRVSSQLTLDTMSLAYGFAKTGETPGWTFSSFVSDAVTSILGLVGGFVSKMLDFVFSFVPQGDKIMLVKDFVSELVGDAWDVGAQDPLLFWHVLVIVSISYGLLLFIDPMFKHLFTGLWMPVRAVWWVLKGLWMIFFWLAQFAISKLTP